MNIPRNEKNSLHWRASIGIFCFVLIVSMLCGVTFQSFAQTTSGTIIGTLTDASGGVVPQTRVVLNNVETSTKNETVTDSSGFYQFFNVPPGSYKITVQKQGYKALSEGPFNLQVEGSLRVDLKLQVGSETQTVTVTAASPLIEAETTSLGGVIDEREATEIPLNGRNPMNLAALVPSVVAQGQSSGTPTGANPYAYNNYQIGGGIANQSGAFLDGSPLNTEYGNTLAFIPSQDSLAEFKVDTNNLTADYGRLSGGAIQFSTKSGTNQLHGALWEYLRNKVLNANDYWANHAGLARPAFTQNQYGFNVGGPLLIPHVYDGRNRTFFFVNWEGFALRQGSTFVETVPTTAELAGDLSGLPGSPALYDPNTTCLSLPCTLPGETNLGDRELIAGANLATGIPAGSPSQINATSLAWLKAFYPPENTPSSTGVNNFTHNASTGGNNYQTVVHIDHNVSDKQHIGSRYTWWKNTNLPIQPYGNGACLDRCGENMLTNDWVLNDTYTFNSTAVLDARISYLRYVYSRVPVLTSFNLSSLGPTWGSYASHIQFPGPPQFDIQGFDNDGTFSGGGSASTIVDANDNDVIAGTFTKVLGKHTLKVGGEFLRGTFNYAQNNDAPGYFSFNSGFTSNNPNVGLGGAGLASYLLGYSYYGTFESVLAIASAQKYPALFVTDDWRTTQKFTVHVGLRWENNLPYTERHNQITYFDTNAVNPILSAAGLNNPGSVEAVASPTRSSRYAYNTDWSEFSPRVGLTYAVTPATVVSLGYGILWLAENYGFNAPNAAPTNTFDTPYTASLNSGFTPAHSIDNPLGAGTIVPAPGRNNFQSILLGTDVTAAVPADPYAYAQQWNVAVQRQFGGNTVLDVAYAGTKGTHLPILLLPIDALPDSDIALGAPALQKQVPNPFYGIINPNYALGAPTIPYAQTLLKYPQYDGVSTYSADWGGSTYNSLQVKFQRRFSAGASVNAAYTYAKLLSNTDTLTTWLESEVAGAWGAMVDPNNLKLEKSLSSNDVRHHLVLSYVYDVPVGRGRKIGSNLSRPADLFVGGWGLEGVTTLQSGYPLGLSVGLNLNSSFPGLSQRPNQVSSCNKQESGSAVSKLNEWFNASCFTQPTIGTFGTEPRNDATLTAPGIANWDTSIFKDFSLDRDERVKLQFRTEFFNLFNRVQFGYPGTYLGIPGFGVVSSDVNNPRLIQFALRLKY